MPKRIVALGGTIAAIKAMEVIQAFEPECSFTVFATEKFYPYRPEVFGDFVSKRVNEDKVFYRPQAFYKKMGVEFLFDKNFDRINLRKSAIITEGKETIPFDRLILADAPAWKFTDIKGASKSGIFTPYRLSDLKSILEVLPLTETVVIETASIECVQLACALKARGKDVVLVFSTPGILPDILDAETSELVMQYLEEFGLRLMRENAIVEVLGEGEVKAVRLQSKKVLSCEQLVLGGSKPDLRFLSESMEDGELAVGEGFTTPHAAVWAVGAPAISLRHAGHLGSLVWNCTPILELQGEMSALSILGKELAPQPCVAESTLNLPDKIISILGEAVKKEGRKEVMRFETRVQGPVYKKIFIAEETLAGAVLVNAESEKEKLLTLIREKTPLGDDPESLLKSDLLAEADAASGLTPPEEAASS